MCWLYMILFELIYFRIYTNVGNKAFSELVCLDLEGLVSD